MINKQNNLRRILIISLALAILVGAAFLVFYLIIQVNLAQAVEYPLSSSYQDTGGYEINSETILDALDRGRTNVFMSILTTPGVASTPNKSWAKGLYIWSQSDYLKVANALLQFAWNDNLEGWHLYSMYFVKGCQDNPAGFDSAEITYFKALHGPFSYTTRVVDIYPGNNGVSWSGDPNFPRPLFGWKSIDPRKFKIAADDALQIAEKKGGSQFRLLVKNACTVDVFINPNPNQEVDWIWHVFYNTDSSGKLLIQVDSETGEAEIVKSNQ